MSLPLRKIKDGATNAVNKLRGGGGGAGFEGEFKKKASVTGQQIGGGPVPAEFLIIVWSETKITQRKTKQEAASAGFHTPQRDVYKLPPPTGFLLQPLTSMTNHFLYTIPPAWDRFVKKEWVIQVWDNMSWFALCSVFKCQYCAVFWRSQLSQSAVEETAAADGRNYWV